MSTPAIEHLELRRHLAGNVTASIVDGTLLIQGDDAANAIIIDTEGLEAGHFRISGEDTTINGEFVPVELGTVAHSVEIDLGAGRSRLILRGALVPEDLVIRTSGGRDEILLDAVQAGGLSIRSGGGRDAIDLVEVSVTGDTEIITSGGSDLITADGASFGTAFLLNAGTGNDSIFLGDATFVGSHEVEGGRGQDRIASQAISRQFDFRDGAQGWQAGFADYFTNDPAGFNFASDIRPLPAQLEQDGTGFFLRGKNISDDLVMYLTRPIGPAEGLKPNMWYQVRYEIEVASNAPSGFSGVGGSPGESVFLKVGASTRAPRTRDIDGHQRLNINHGQQGGDGRSATVIGNIANGIEEIDPPYVSLQRKGIHRHRVKTDAQGRLHLFVGTESGYESTTALYYESINVQLIPLAPG